MPEARTKFEAEQAEIEAKKAVFEGRYGRPTGEYDFAKFVGDPNAKDDEFEAGTYLAWAKENKRSWRHDQFRVKVLIEFFKSRTFAQISPMLIEKLKKERRESKVTFKKKPDRSRSPSSVNRELELLSKIFSLAVKYRVTADNPCSDVKLLPVDNKRIRYLTDEEMPRLFAQLTGQRAHLRPLVIVAIGTGMRLGDQLSLGWEQVDFQRNLIYAPNARMGKDYPLPMNKDVRRDFWRFTDDAPAAGLSSSIRRPARVSKRSRRASRPPAAWPGSRTYVGTTCGTLSGPDSPKMVTARPRLPS